MVVKRQETKPDLLLVIPPVAPFVACELHFCNRLCLELTASLINAMTALSL